MASGGSYLIVPGLEESALDDPVKSLEDATRADPDVTVIDLEDGVGPSMKALARETTVRALNDWANADRTFFVRVNGVETPHAFEDLRALHAADSPPDAVVVPDVRCASDVRTVSEFLESVDSSMGIAPLIERPSAVFDARSIARASPRVEALVFGSLDFRKNMGMPTMERDPDVSLPRYVVSMAASSVDVPAIDTVYLHREDFDGLRAEAERARSIGFDGKLATSVEQVPIVDEVFAPSAEEISYAKRIVEAFDDAGDDTGLITVDGTTVDKPIVDEQLALLARAEDAGIDIDEI